MTAKRLTQMASLIVLLGIASPASSALVVPSSLNPTSAGKTEDSRAQVLIERLEVIKGMDISEMTRSEKKSLRKEVKGIKKEMKKNSKGLYLSLGAIIIIVLLLILIL